jgi:hypothetical protein
MFITPEIAKVHLRDPVADESDLALKSTAAEQAAVLYLDRAVFASQDALNEAVAQVPATLATVKAAYAAADAAAGLIADIDLCLIEKTYAFDVYLEAKFAAARIRRGLVINSAIQSAMLLILGHLWENREDVITGTIATELPNGARCLLDAYRHYGA